MKKFFYALLGFLTGSWLVDQFVNRNNDPWKPATDCSPEDVPIVTFTRNGNVGGSLTVAAWIMDKNGNWHKNQTWTKQ